MKTFLEKRVSKYNSTKVYTLEARTSIVVYPGKNLSICNRFKSCANFLAIWCNVLKIRIAVNTVGTASPENASLYNTNKLLGVKYLGKVTPIKNRKSFNVTSCHLMPVSL